MFEFEKLEPPQTANGRAAAQQTTGVVIPRHADVGGDGAPRMTGGEAAVLIQELYRVALDHGYAKVRLDRAQNAAGDWFELGYSLGEVAVRWSHTKRRTLFRRASSAQALEFGRLLDQQTQRGES